MKDVLNLDKPPETEKTCEKCAYLEGGKNFNTKDFKSFVSTNFTTRAIMNYISVYDNIYK